MLQGRYTYMRVGLDSKRAFRFPWSVAKAMDQAIDRRKSESSCASRLYQLIRVNLWFLVSSHLIRLGRPMTCSDD